MVALKKVWLFTIVLIAVGFTIHNGINMEGRLISKKELKKNRRDWRSCAYMHEEFKLLSLPREYMDQNFRF